MLTRLPLVTFKTRVRDESIVGNNPYRWKDQTSTDLFGGKRVVLFALPGAYTPTCTSTHLPRYEALYGEFKSAGIDEIFCLSVNDAFVMFNWARSLEVEKVKLLPDGSGEFTRKMGMLVSKDNLGFGMRSWRYALVANDMTIEHALIEPDLDDNSSTDPFELSDADTVLARVTGAQPPQKRPARQAFVG